MKYKLIAIDMDGTLLNSKNQVSQRTKQAIYKASEKGVHIVLATGRILRSALHYSNLLTLRNPVVASNGAVIVDGASNIVHKKTIDKNSIRDLIDVANKNNIYCHFYDESYFYSTMRVKEVLEFYNEGDSELNIEMKLFKDIEDVISQENINIYKFLFVEEDLDKLSRFRKKLSAVENISISSSWSNNVEAMALNVSKGEALKKLCKDLNINPQEVIAIGDSENDLSMLSFAGLSVAMGNAKEIIMKQSDYVADSNDNDGVAKVIEKFILGQES